MRAQNLTPKGLSLSTVVFFFFRRCMFVVIDNLQSLEPLVVFFQSLNVSLPWQFFLNFGSFTESLLFFLVSEHFSRVDADPHEVALWVLLKKTKSTDKAVRLQAVQELAENHHWHGIRLV